MTSTLPASKNASFLDGRPLSSLQIRTLILCALVAMLDGNDTQVIGIGAPLIAKALHVAPSAMGWVISGSWLGAAVGAVVLGGMADRFGRKPILIAATLLFGVFTLLTPWAKNLPMLVGVRMLACIGLGGATPCFLSLASEYTPANRRATFVSFVYAAFPLGILLGSLLNGWILSRASWRYMFYFGGAVPVGTALVLLTLLPESIGLLLRRPKSRQAERILAAIAPGLSLQAARATLNSFPYARHAGNPMDLFQNGRTTATLSLWLMLFACFGTAASTVWLPTILQQNGASPAASAVAASFVGLGSCVGFIIAGRLIDRFGLVRALLGPLVAGAAATAALGVWPGSIGAESVFVMLVGALVGMGVSGGVSLVTLVYPSAMRSTAAGWAMGLGRVGQVSIPGVFAIVLHQGWSTQSIFSALGVMPLVAAAAVLVLASALPANVDPALLPPPGLAPLHSRSSSM